MDAITLDGTAYNMNEIIRMELVRKDNTEPAVFEIMVTFSNGSNGFYEMTTENVASMNAWIAYTLTFVPKPARGMKGPR
jgi:hypothetical protein